MDLVGSNHKLELPLERPIYTLSVWLATKNILTSKTPDTPSSRLVRWSCVANDTTPTRHSAIPWGDRSLVRSRPISC